MAAIAAPAVRIGISSSFCFIQTCPGVQPPVPTTVPSGAPFGVYIAALDGSGVRDAGYTGTVVFSSSDPLATLPASDTFVTADGGVKAFSAVLRTLGEQTITVSDPENNLNPGTLVMTVTRAQVPEAIPILSFEASVLLAVLLGAVGTLLVGLRS
ncbi:MAG TPA: hypothetical protein VFW15_02975 [Thermoanaerobaculia bacterium]|nr:hypothetical protein [Thermoanaerobaculia bacterium]